MECLTVWCKQNLSFALATTTSASRLGGVLNDVLLPIIYTYTGSIARGFWLGFLFSLICLASCVAIVVMDSWYGRQYQSDSDSFPATSVIGLFRGFSMLYYLLCLLSGFVYMSFTAFNASASSLNQIRFGFSVEAAGFIIVLPSCHVIVHSFAHHHWKSTLWDNVGSYKQV